MMSEIRITATQRKQAAMITSTSGCFAMGRPSLIAVPMNMPAPAAPTPVTIARSNGLEAAKSA
jgi:hypothetical protein